MRSTLTHHFPKARNVSLPGVEPYPNVASLTSRFTCHGFTTSHAITLRDIRRTCINRAELERYARDKFLVEHMSANSRQDIAP